MQSAQLPRGVRAFQGSARPDASGSQSRAASLRFWVGPNNTGSALGRHISVTQFDSSASAGHHPPNNGSRSPSCGGPETTNSRCVAAAAFSSSARKAPAFSSSSPLSGRTTVPRVPRPSLATTATPGDRASTAQTATRFSRHATHPSTSPTPPSSSPSSSANPHSHPIQLLSSTTDLRLDLWLSLLQATAVQLTSATTSATTAASGVAARLQRLTQPPPPGFPAGPPGDQTLALLSDPLRFLSETTARYGPVVGLLLGGERVVLVSGREEAHAVLIDQAGTVYVKEGTAFFPGSSLAGNGLLVSDGAVWQRQRRLASPAFRRTAVEAYGSAMVAATEDMMGRVWGQGGVWDVYADFNELTLQVTLEALFGFGAEERNQPHHQNQRHDQDQDDLQQQQRHQQQGLAPQQSQHELHAGQQQQPHYTTTTSSALAPSASQRQPQLSRISPPSHSASSPSAASREEAQQIVAAVQQAFTFFTQRAATGFVIPEWLPTWDNLQFAAAVQQLDKVVYGMIARRRHLLTATHGSVAAAAAAAAAARNGAGGGGAAAAVPSDLLTSLLLARDEEGCGMSDGALRDELMTLLVAGQETSAILLGWAAALLAAHPEVQAAAAAEVRQVCGEEGALPTAASVRHVPYLESVVLETLRLYSPAYMVGRCARVATTLGGDNSSGGGGSSTRYSLPAGTTVLVSPYIMHRDPAVWEQPEAFRPDRWHPLQRREGYQGYMGLMSGLGPNGAYLPFGGGPRNCIGSGFAMMEALLVLAAVLQRYSLDLPYSAPYTAAAAAAASSTIESMSDFPRPKPLLTLRPEAVVLRITPRR